MLKATITLSRPLVRGETNITEVTLREPNAGSLRGLRLTDLLNGDVDSVATLLPRISEPSISSNEAVNLAAVDLGQISGEIMGFFQPADSGN